MKLETGEQPKQVEKKLLGLIIPDAIIMFLLLNILLDVGVYLSEFFIFPDILLIFFAVLLFSAVLTVLRFFGYFSIVVRVMGALQHAFEAFGKGTPHLTIDIGRPFVLLGKVLGASPSKPAFPSFILQSKSEKYTASVSIALKKKTAISISVVDWHQKTHSGTEECKPQEVQKCMHALTTRLRQEVIESKGAAVATHKEEYYVPAAAAKAPAPTPHEVKKTGIVTQTYPPKPTATGLAAVDEQLSELEDLLKKKSAK